MNESLNQGFAEMRDR